MRCVLTIFSGLERFLQATGAIPVGLIGMNKETAVQCVEFIADPSRLSKSTGSKVQSGGEVTR